jgi:hypothetical protein
MTMPEKKIPAPGTTGSGVKGCQNTGDDYRSDLTESKQVFWIYVYPDGREERLDYEPPHKVTLRIEQYGNTQYTWTKNQGHLERDGYTRCMYPPGRGWELYNDDSDHFTQWLRVVGASDNARI